MRIVLALARLQTMSDAGVVLKLSHSTVSRRLQALQDSLNTRLFDYRGKAWHLTMAGQEIFEVAQRMELQMQAIDRTLIGQDNRLAGLVQLSTVDILAMLFAKTFKAFGKEHPEITLDVSCTGRVVSLTNREADVVLRLQNTPPEHLVGYRLCRLEHAVYVAESLLDELGMLDCTDRTWSPRDLPWLLWNERTSACITSSWLRRHVGTSNTACIVDHPAAMIDYIRQGIGAGVVACGFFEGVAGVRRMTGLLPGFGVDLWLLTHEDLRHTARIKALMQFLRDAMPSKLEMLEGTCIAQEDRFI